MTEPGSIDFILAMAILSTAWLCLSSRILFKAVVLFMCLGLLITLTWARLDAWDVAIAEAVIGAGITGVLLLSAAYHSSKQTRSTNSLCKSEREDAS